MKQNLISALLFIVFSQLTSAGTMGDNSSRDFQIMGSFQGGYAEINSSNSTKTFMAGDNNLFIYKPTHGAPNSSFYGFFIGGEKFLREIVSHPLFLQAGLEYNNVSKTKITGVNSVGVDPLSSTFYNYKFNIKTQQILGKIKLLAASHHNFFPYGEAGLGVAFNNANHFTASTTETGSVNFTPTFVGQNSLKLSFILGLGIDSKLNNHFRFGLGYRYSYFNAATLGNGYVSANSSEIPVTFKPSTSKIYANQLLGHITYIA